MSVESPALRVFWQPRKPMFWGYVALAVAGAVALVRQFEAVASLPVWVPLCVVAVNCAVGLILFLVITRLTVLRATPGPLLAAAGAWGVLIAGWLGTQANEPVMSVLLKLGVDRRWVPAIAAPTTEEWVKTAGVVAVVLIGRRFVVRPMQGMVLGACCGLGFQLTEDAAYAISAVFADPLSDAGGLWPMVAQRAVGGDPTHWMWTGISGLGVAYAVTRGDRPLIRRGLVALSAFALAWLLHCAWNSPLFQELGSDWVVLVARPIAFVLVFVAVWRVALRTEWRWFAAVLQNEPSWVITRTELASLRTRRRRRHARKAMAWHPARAAIGLIQRAQMELAGTVDPRAAAGIREEIAMLRARLATERDPWADTWPTSEVPQ